MLTTLLNYFTVHLEPRIKPVIPRPDARSDGFVGTMDAFLATDQRRFAPSSVTIKEKPTFYVSVSTLENKLINLYERLNSSPNITNFKIIGIPLNTTSQSKSLAELIDSNEYLQFIEIPISGFKQNQMLPIFNALETNTKLITFKGTCAEGDNQERADNWSSAEVEAIADVVKYNKKLLHIDLYGRELSIEEKDYRKASDLLKPIYHGKEGKDSFGCRPSLNIGFCGKTIYVSISTKESLATLANELIAEKKANKKVGLQHITPSYAHGHAGDDD